MLYRIISWKVSLDLHLCLYELQQMYQALCLGVQSARDKWIYVHNMLHSSKTIIKTQLLFSLKCRLMVNISAFRRIDQCVPYKINIHWQIEPDVTKTFNRGYCDPNVGLVNKCVNVKLSTSVTWSDWSMFLYFPLSRTENKCGSTLKGDCP